MEDKLKNLQSQMAEHLIRTQKLMDKSSQMVVMMQNIQELLKKSFNFSPNSDLNANTENHQEFPQITPNSFPNSNSNSSSKNHPPKSFGYVPKLEFSVFDGINSGNRLQKSLEKVSAFDVEVKDSLETVSQYYSEDDKQGPISFSALPVCYDTSEVVQGLEQRIYACGTSDDELHKLCEPVKPWKTIVSGMKADYSVLTESNNWLNLGKTRDFYEGCRRTLLIALNFVNILKWKLGLHGKFVWYKLSKILDVLEEKPPPDDLVAHKQLLAKAVEQDEGDGPGDDESIEWLWDIFWRFDGIFEGLEHLPKFVELMASIVVETGMIREAELLLSVAEKQGILLACDDIYIGLVKGYVRAGELELAVSISSSCYRFVFGFLIEERKVECAISVDEEAVQVEFGTYETRHLESLVGFSLFRWDDNRNQKTVTTGWKPRRVNSSKVTNMYCEKRDFEEALKFFSKMKCAPSIVVVNRAIHLLCSHFGIGRAGLFLWELKKIGYISNEIILGVLISFCCREAFWFLSDIFTRGLKPGSCSYNALIRMMFTAGMMHHTFIHSYIIWLNHLT